jgi:hypothetical protein
MEVAEETEALEVVEAAQEDLAWAEKKLVVFIQLRSFTFLKIYFIRFF